MRFGLSVPNFAEPDRLLDIARAAEASGWDRWFLWDHILVDREHAVPVSEPWTVLAAAAMATARIRLGTMVTPIARRRPWVLAAPGDHRRSPVERTGRAGRRTWRAARGRVRAVRRVVRSETTLRLLLKGSPCSTPCGRASQSLTGVPPTGSTACSSRRVQFSNRACRFGRRARYPLVLACGGPRVGTASCRSMPRTPSSVRPVRTRWRRRLPTSPTRGERWMISRLRCGQWRTTPRHVPRTERAGATWIIEGPAPGDHWLDDAAGMASDGPPH